LFRIDRNYVNLAYAESVEIIGKVVPDIAVADDANAAQASTDSSAEPAVVTIPNKAVSEAREQAEREAEKIIQAAEEEAGEIVHAAQEDAERIFEETKQQAYEMGFSEGSIDGKAAYEKKAVEDDEKLKNVIEQVSSSFQKLTDGLEDEILNLSLQIIKKVINFSDEAAYDLYTAMIKNAVKQMKPAEKITIRIAADEYERFFASGNMVIELENGTTVSALLIKDPALAPGDAIIDTGDETINAGFDTQLENIELMFKQSD
jgi:flagellar assembly protein FliH